MSVGVSESSSRILTIKSLVPRATRLLDIGCDHAEVPISLVKENSILSAIASDINVGPLERARKNAEKEGVADRFTFIISDGFANIESGSFDCAAICGMGGLLIAKIIGDGAEKAKTTLVLQPMTDFDVLRMYLWENGFEITEEKYCAEGVRPYVVISSRFTGKTTDYTFSDLFIGKIRPKTPEFRSFIEKIGRGINKRIAGKKHLGEDYSELELLSEEIISICS